MQEKKQCSKCLLWQPLEEFSIKSGQCKACKRAYTKSYLKTEQGLLKQMYSTLAKKSSNRLHPLPDFTYEELVLFLYKNGFQNMYTKWKGSGYLTKLKPSIDRLNSTLPYSIRNIRLVVWETNNNAAYSERKQGGRITRQNKTCIQKTLDGVFVKEYPSFAYAARVNNFCRTNLGRAATDGTVARGFLWEYGEPKVQNTLTPRDVINK